MAQLVDKSGVTVFDGTIIGGGGGDVLTALTHLSAAVLFDLVNNPAVVVPAPGATSVLNLLSVVAVYHEGTVPYADGGVGLTVEARQNLTIPKNLYTSGHDRYYAGPFPFTVADTVNDVNVPAIVYPDTGALVDGDGTIDITVYYTIIDTA